MSIPGLSYFPELEARYRQKLRELRGSKRDCVPCDERKLTERFRSMVEERLKRDKSRYSA